jgi:hypothetical protein
VSYVRSMLTRAGIGFALLGLGPMVGSAQEWWWPPSMAVEPPAPDTDDPLTITLSGNWPDSCIPNGSSVSPPTGGVIDFALVWDYPPDIACLTVITPWERSEKLEPLPAGRYEVRATLYDGSTGRPILGLTPVGAFTVIPATHPGDMNCDGTVDFDDINPFVTCLVNGACP